VVPGILQDKSGPSVATEFGVLLPDSTGNSGVGASWAGIVSQRWDWGTAHFNAETALTRDHHADVFVGTILEGPPKWGMIRWYERSRTSAKRIQEMWCISLAVTRKGSLMVATSGRSSCLGIPLQSPQTNSWKSKDMPMM
jgi:hypothetical protein